MSGQIVAKPGVIKSIGDDITQMGESVTLARGYLNDHVKVSDDNGLYLRLVGNVIEEKRAYLDGWYQEYATHIAECGADVRRVSREFAARDEEDRVRFDRKHDIVVRDLNGNVGYTFQSPRSYQQEHSYYVPEKPGFGEKQASSVLLDPVNQYGAGDYHVQAIYWEISDWIEKGTQWADEIKPITALGLPNPFEGWKDDWEGRWEDIGTSGNALIILGGYWERVSRECLGTLGRFHDAWEGRAAKTAASWLDAFIDQNIEHKAGLHNLSYMIMNRGLLLKDAIIPIVELMEDLANTVLSIMAFGEDISDLKGIGESLLKGNLGDALSGLLSFGDDLADKVGGLFKSLGKLIDDAKIAISLAIFVLDLLFNIGDDVSNADMGVTNFWSTHTLPEARRR